MAGPCALIRRSSSALTFSIRSLLANSPLFESHTQHAVYKYDSPLHRTFSATLSSEIASPRQEETATLPLSQLLDYHTLKLRALASTPLSAALDAPARDLPARVSYLLRSFRRSAALRERALASGINDTLFTSASFEFTKLLHSSLNPEAGAALCALEDDDAARAMLFSCFRDYTNECYGKEIETQMALVKTLNLSNPHTWYPMARALKRKIIYHAGATNSGKTYNALQAMRAAASGVYCGPLRLLAMEIYDSCNADGTLCDLITGQERREVGAAHLACTVEMVNLSKRVDVAVIDEIQMIGDASRGYAWTRALLGVPAAEVHICGDGSAVDLVKWMAREMNEEVEVRSYDRFTPLSVEQGGLENRSYESVRPGDCIVAFSRQNIYAIKAAVEGATPFKACIIYGALPPEVRRRQARLFNDPENEYSVMVASDAVGMGLNLNIGRVIFNSLHKREFTGSSSGGSSSSSGSKSGGGGGGKQFVPVSTSAVKQIAGRAGRRSSQFKEGKTTCLDPGMVPLLAAHLAAPLEATATPRAGLAPEFDQLEAFASQKKTETPFSVLLKEFEELAEVDGRYFFARQEAITAAAVLLEGVKDLSLKDMYTFAMAPASSTDPRIMAALLHWTRRYAAGKSCPLDLVPPADAPTSPEEMRAFESAHNIVALWLWLSFRFDSEFFPHRDQVQAIGERICTLLAEGLEHITVSGKAAQSEMSSASSAASYSGLSEVEAKKRKKKERKAKYLRKAKVEYKDLHSHMFAAYEGEVANVVKAAKVAAALRNKQQQGCSSSSSDDDDDDEEEKDFKSLRKKRKTKKVRQQRKLKKVKLMSVKRRK